MPSLNWIGKEKIVNHDKEVPFRLLKKVEKYSLGKDSENLIIEGDNLEALKALMPYYVGQVKCIYIDPPYNTGNEGWVYNDRVNAPKIKEWLGKVVGGEGEDLTRHDKWLCMMYPRLKLLRDLLRDDGVIFISIDDNEHCHLKIIMDEIFGSENFIGSIVWQKRKGGGNDSAQIAVDHEYIVVYVKNIELQEQWRVDYEGEYLKRYKLKDELGNYYWDTLSRPGLNNPIIFDVKCPDGSVIKKGKWQISKKEFDIQLGNGEVKIEKNNRNEWVVFHKVRMPSGRVFRSIFTDVTNKDAADEMEEIFKDKKAFSNPKPSNLIKNIIKMASNNEDLILDSFAGSGTTADAVMQLNKEEKGSNRKFILVELEKEIAQKITSERVRKVSEGLNGHFSYEVLSEPLFNANGTITEQVSYDAFAQYIYFTETHTNLNTKEITDPKIGELNEIEYYLIYKKPKENLLDKSFLKNIKKNKIQKVVYADKNTLSDDILLEYGIIFKQIPYEVKVY